MRCSCLPAEYLAVSSTVLADAVLLAGSQAGSVDMLCIPLPCTSAREAKILVSALYARDLPGLLRSLPAEPELRELSRVAHRLGCIAVLGSLDAVTARKAASEEGWLTPDNALSTLAWAESMGLAALHGQTAEYIASNLQDISLDGAAGEAGDNLLAVLRSVQGKGTGSSKRPKLT